jgi:molybdopterin converting factor small subunit
MNITLRSVMDIAAALGTKEQSLDVPEAVTVQGLLTILCATHGERLTALLLQSMAPVKLAPHVKVYVNGRGAVFLQGLDTVLHDGDDVLLMPQVSGG